MPDDAVLSVVVDSSGAERGSQGVRRSLEDISRSASTSMSAVERYNTTLGAGATAADIFQHQTAAMAAQLKVLEETTTANARVVSDLGTKFEVIRNAAKSAVSALLEFGKTKFTGDVTAQIDRLANDMTRAMDAGGKGALEAARASQREILSIAKAGLADQLELVKQEAMKRVAGAQKEWERVKALHLGARTEIATQERSAAQQALSEAKKAGNDLVAATKETNDQIYREIKSRTDQIISLKQRENAVQAEYERSYDSLTRVQRQADATLSRLLTTEKEHAAQQVAEAQDSERLLAVVRRGIQAREANAVAIVAETNAIHEQSTVMQQAGHYSVSNAGLVSSTLPALPKAPVSGGHEVQQESVDVAALADELEKLVLRYDFASAATARRTEAIDTLRTAQRVGILDDDEEFERLRKLVSGEQQHADALTTLKAQYSGASDAERRYATELERVTTILNDANASDADRAAILRNVAQAYDPAIAAAEKTVIENDRLASSYKALMGQIDPAIAQQARYESALADVVAYHASVGSSTDTMAAAMDHVREKLSPAAIETKKLTDENAKATDSYRALIGQIDTAVGQQQRYESELAKLRAGHQALGISAEQAAIEEAKLTDALSPAGIAAQKEATALQSLLDRLNPADKASRELAAGADLLRKALAAEGADVEKLTASLAKLEAEQKKVASGGPSKGESHINQQVLGSVGVNTIQSLASGIPIQTVAMTQGTQLLTLLQGGSKALLLYGAAAALAVGPVLALAGAVVTYTASLREIERVSRLTGNAAGMTTAQIVAQADASAKAAGISSASARSITAQYIGTGKIGGQMLGDLTKATKDWAVATSQDTDKASSDLAGMFVDPAKAAAELAQKYGMFSDAQVQVIKNYQAQGDLERAQSALLDGIKSRTQGAAESVAWYAKVWESVSRNVSDGFTAIGKFGSEKSLDDRISDYERSQRTITQRGGVVQNQQNQGVRFTQRGGIIAAPQEQYAQDLWDFGQRQAQAAHAKTEAAVEKLKSEVMDFTRSVDPSINATQSLTNAEALLTKAVGAGAISLQEKTRLLALYGAQLEQTANPAKAFALDMERQAKVMEAAAGRARDFEQQRQAVLQKRGAQPTDALSAAETADINRGLNAKYDAQANDAHRTATQAIDDARLLAAATAAISPAATVAAQARIAYNATIRSTTDAMHPLGDVTKAQQAYDDSLTKGTIELNAQFDASVKTAALAVDAAGRLAIAQAQGGDMAMAQARAQNLYAEQVARGVDPTKALALATLDYQKSLIDLSGQISAWNREQAEAISSSALLADAELKGGIAVAEANTQAKARAQILKEGVPFESDRAKAIMATTRALDEQNREASINRQIFQNQQQTAYAGTQLATIGMPTTERERVLALTKARNDLDAAGIAQENERGQAYLHSVEALTQANQQVQRLEGAWTAVGQSFDNAFTRPLESVVDAIVKGQGETLKWGDIIKGMKVSLLGDALKIGANSIKNTVLGTNDPTLSDVLSILTGSSANDNAKAVNDNLIGRSPGSPMWVQVAGNTALAASPTSLATPAGLGQALAQGMTQASQPMPVAVKDAGALNTLVEQIGAKYGIDSALIKGIIQQESSWNPNAVNSRSGAAGLMQIMPANFKAYGVTNPFDPAQNIDAGTRILKEHLVRAGGDMDKALSTYSGHIKTSGAAYVSAVNGSADGYRRADAGLRLVADNTRGVAVAQEQQLQAQLDAAGAQNVATGSAQALSASQESLIASVLGTANAATTTTASIEVLARPMDRLKDGAISAADAQMGAAQGAGVLADAATGFAGTVGQAASGLWDWVARLFSSGSGDAAPTQSGGGAVESTILNQGVGQIKSLASKSLADRAVNYLGLGDSYSSLMNTPLWGSAVSMSSTGAAAYTGTLVANPALYGPGLVQAGSLNAANGVVNAGNTAALNASYSGTTSGAAGTAGGTLGGVVGSAGAGAFGGMIGGYLGTATNSKAVGGLSGAALGAGASYLSAALGFGAMGGPVGLAIAAVVGGIMGMLGTQKKSVGPTGQATIFGDVGGQVRFVNAAADNGGDAGPVQTAAKAAVAAINGVYKGYGGSMTAGFGNNPGLISQGGKFEATLGDGKSIGKYDTLDEASTEFAKAVLSKASTDIAPDVQTALKNTTAKTLTDLATDLDFAGSFKKTAAALMGDFGFDDAATKTAKENADALAKSFTDWSEKTKALGLDTDLATKAAQAHAVALVQGRDATKDLTAGEQQLRALQLQWAEMPRVFEAAGFAADKAAQMAKDGYEHAMAAIRQTTQEGWVSANRASRGVGSINSAEALVKQFNIDIRDAAAKGMDDGVIRNTFGNDLNKLFSGLAPEERAASIRELSGAGVVLAGTTKEMTAAILDAARAADAAATAQDRLAAQQNLQDRNRSLRGVGGVNDIEAAVKQFRSDQAVNPALAADTFDRAIRDIVSKMDEAARAASIRELSGSGVVLGGGDVALTQAILGVVRSASAIADAETAVTKTRQSAVTALQREQSTLTQTRDKMKSLFDTLKSTSDSLNTDSSLSPYSLADQRAEAFKQLFQAANDSRSSDPATAAAAIEKVNTLSRSALEASKAYYATSEAYFADFNTVQGILAATRTVADQQAQTVDASLTVLRDQLTSLGEINDSVLSVADALAAYQGAVNALATAKAATVTPAATTVGPVATSAAVTPPTAAAVGGLPADSVGAIAASRPSPWLDPTFGNQITVNNAYQAVFGRNADPTGMANWLGVMAGGEVNYQAIVDDLSKAKLAGAREFGGPVLAGQAYLVGERRPEVFVPSVNGAIVPSVGQYQDQFAFAANDRYSASNTNFSAPPPPARPSGDSNMAGLIAELRASNAAIRAELAAIKAEIARNTAVTGGGAVEIKGAVEKTGATRAEIAEQRRKAAAS